MYKIRQYYRAIIYRFKIGIKIFLNPKLGYQIFKPDQPRQITILNKLGQGRSIVEKKSVDAIGNPIPWFTYPAIEYLSQLDFSKHAVLEWGCGNSTLFFSKRCQSITSIEHNKDWYQKIKKSLPTNAQLIFAEEDKYATTPFNLNSLFDLIIVDGIKRFECLKSAVKLIEKTGVIIFDNSDRNPEYCEFLQDMGFLQIDFHGFGPINYYTWTTSIFVRRIFKLKPKTIQPVVPFGGGY